MKKGYVYILTNQTGSVLYIGVTSDIIKRIYEHKEKLVEGFSKKYSLDKLVYYECFDDIKDAIAREKQLKGGSRKKKLDLVSSMNPKWDDMYSKILA
jgi:putative endonuclease